MSIRVFGVTYTTVQADVLPMFDVPDANTNPSSTRMTEWIKQEAAELQAKLLKETISAEAVYALGEDEAPYLWCRKSLTLMVGIRWAKVLTSQYPELAKALQDELDGRWKELDDLGDVALGSTSLASESGTSPEGPTTHISELGLDTGDPDDASDVVPELRRSDLL